MVTGSIKASQSDTLSKVITSLRATISGENYKNEEVVPFVPSSNFFIGNLLPLSKIIPSSSKFAPTSMGIEFKVKKSEASKAEIVIDVSCAFYYRVLPSFEEQLRFYKIGSSLTSGQSSVKQLQLDTLFKKIYVRPNQINININDLLDKSGLKSEVRLGIEDIIKKATEDAGKDISIFRLGRHRSQKIPIDILSDAGTYYKYIEENLQSVCIPKWRGELIAKVYEESEEYRIQIILLNLAQTERGNTYENSMFEAQIKLGIKNIGFSQFELNSISDTYKYSKVVGAIGINCSIIDQGNKLITEYMPKFEQLETVPRAKATFDMEKLVYDPIPVLETGVFELRSGITEFKEAFASKISETNKGKFDADVASCEAELARFEYGISLLKKHETALEAFKLMNKSFLNTRRQYTSWRLFQLVFIVSILPDILSEEYNIDKNTREDVSLLYYPTGGGKTEAFLGVAVFQAFFDRLTGKKTGVSVLTKFPLRMLSLQQLQRVADIFTSAEKIRLETKEISGKDYERFSVGYYVGDNNTPNALVKKVYGGPPINILEHMSDADLQKYLIVEHCPFCFDGKVKVTKDIGAVRLKHVCQKCGKELNVFVSDEEVYRYLPTFIVSTLDKIVICGLQKDFRNILGQVRYKCPMHGYTSVDPSTKSFCVVDNCAVTTEKFERISGLHRPEPSLLIQDELHLVRESMGTFDSHYETLINHMIHELSGGKRTVKVLAATATIADYEKQIYELYLKEAVKFPAVIEVYAKNLDNVPPKRQIYGIMPHGRSRLNSILPILVQLFKEIGKLKSQYAKLGEELNPEYANLLLGNLNTVLLYNLKKQDAFEVHRAIRTMVNRELYETGHNDITTQMITGDVTFDKIRQITEKVEHGNEVDLLLSTSSISHGVDIDKLNIMCFRGMPDNVAEYIQAMSRVGRSYPGLVIVLFDPRKERDQSYYKYFGKFHELYDLLIEGSPLNRWSKKGFEITLPGIFSASILNYFDLNAPATQQRLDLCKNWKSAYSTGVISDSTIKTFINTAMMGSKGAPYAWVKREIERDTTRIIQKLLDTDEGIKPIYMVMDPKPLMNLRNISNDVTIAPDSDSEVIISEYGARSQENNEVI
jgi:hypothetical protein